MYPVHLYFQCRKYSVSEFLVESVTATQCHRELIARSAVNVDSAPQGGQPLAVGALKLEVQVGKYIHDIAGLFIG